MKKHVKTPIFKHLLQAVYLSSAMAVPSYVMAVEVGVGIGAGAGAKSGLGTVDTRGSVGINTGISANGSSGGGSVTGTGTGAATTSTGTLTGTGSVNSTTTTTTGAGATGGAATSTTGGGAAAGIGAGGQITGPATTPPGLDGNLNQNAQTLPDATRGLERAEERMNTQGEGEDQTTVKSRASIKANKNTRTRSNTTQ